MTHMFLFLSAGMKNVINFLHLVIKYVMIHPTICNITNGQMFCGTYFIFVNGWQIINTYSVFSLYHLGQIISLSKLYLVSVKFCMFLRIKLIRLSKILFYAYALKMYTVIVINPKKFLPYYIWKFDTLQIYLIR